jgi:predicted ABC-type transport system involved in lysophospholipase L1 biosynthesis ATPase subunit
MKITDPAPPDSHPLHPGSLHPGSLHPSRRTQPGLVFPDGVDEVVCDRQAKTMSHDEVSAVVVGNRLLILPIHPTLVDSSVRVDPDPSIWAALEMVVSDANHVDDVGDLGDLGDVGDVADVSDANSHEGSVRVQSDLSFPVEMARPLRLGQPGQAGQYRNRPAIELIGVRHRLDSETSGTRPAGVRPLMLTADLQVAQGEFIALVGARKWSSRLLFLLMSGLSDPEAGMVLHYGVPIGLAGVDRDRFDQGLPGVLAPQIAVVDGMCTEEFVAYPMLTYGVSRDLAIQQAYGAMVAVGVGELLGQPMTDLSPVDRHRIGVARSLAGPWESRYLFDPLHGLHGDDASMIRNAILLRVATAEAMVVLTDDPDLLHEADRVIGVSEGRLYEAVRRSS